MCHIGEFWGVIYGSFRGSFEEFWERNGSLGVFLPEFWRIVGNKREFSDRARELLGVFKRVYRSVLGSSVRGVIESRCDGVFGCRFGELPLGESRVFQVPVLVYSLVIFF